MYNIEKTRKLLNYINNPMSREGINVLYSANNINYDRCQLYSEPSNYGFLDGLWAGWDLRKTIDGNLYLTGNIP